VTETTASALREKSKLRRHFRRFDVYFYLICTVVAIDTIGAVASNGAQGFTWLIFLGLFFFLPYALSISELGSAFPQEGGPYVWTRLAFGRPLAAVNSVIYWISNPIWVGGSLTRWLISERSVGALGIDAMGIDTGADTSSGANQALLHGRRLHLENLTGLGEMPPAGGWIIVGGLRVRGGSGSPATVFGLVP
jgi:amino acid transporter